MRAMLDVFKSVIQTLEESGTDYMVVGSIAAMLYGEPRLTADMDVVVEIPPALVPSFDKLFPPSVFYVPPPEVIGREVVNRRQFNILDMESGLKIDFIVRRADPHSVAEFARKRRVPLLPGFEAFVASPEDVILKKLVYFREGGSEKHLTDIKGILTQTAVDEAYIERWVGALGLSGAWASAKT